MNRGHLSDLAGINALPDGAALEFGPGLTVIYGRNGTGKSGFTRLFGNTCFSGHNWQHLGKEGNHLVSG
jgi:predicted ATPase